MGYHYRARYEFILFFEKGKRRLNDLGVADVISVPRIHRGYPAEKPAAVSEVLISQSSAAGRRGRRSVHGLGQRRRGGARSSDAGSCGTDLNPEAVRLTADRLRQFGEGQAPAGPAATGEPEPARRSIGLTRCDGRGIREPGRVLRVEAASARAA